MFIAIMESRQNKKSEQLLLRFSQNFEKYFNYWIIASPKSFIHLNNLKNKIIDLITSLTSKLNNTLFSINASKVISEIIFKGCTLFKYF